MEDDCSAHCCHLSHFCHSSPVLSIHINRFCQPHHFCQLLSIRSSPVVSTISTTYVATDEVTTFVNKARPFLSTVVVLPIYELILVIYYFVLVNQILSIHVFLLYFMICKTTLCFVLVSIAYTNFFNPRKSL